MDELLLNFLFVLLSILVIIYDILTLPIYFLLQKPWIKWKRRKNIWARQINQGDPKSPYKSLVKVKGLYSNINTVTELFEYSLRKNGDRRFCGTRELYRIEEVPQKNGKVFKKLVLGDFKWITMKQADEMITNLARGLRNLGLSPKDKLIFLAETTAEWFLTAQACFRTNIIVSTLYTNLGDDGLVHGINETESSHILISSEILPKLKMLMPQMKNIKHIIYVEGMTPPDLTGFPQGVNIISFSQLRSSGENLDIKLEKPSPQDIAVLMYTSGSTGPPKGVLIPNKCIMTAVKGIMNDCGYVVEEAPVHAAYLPLAHIFELIAEILCLPGTAIAYSSPLSLMDNSTGLKRGCKGDLTLLQPVTLFTVPLMLDRIRKGVCEAVSSKGAFSTRIFQVGMKYKTFWASKGFGTPLLNRFIFNDIKRVAGGRTKYVVCGGAPLAPSTVEFIETCLEAKIIQVYGLTETTGCGTLSRVGDSQGSRVGPPITVGLIRLVDWDEGNYHPTDKPYPRGEVVISSEGVTAGYYKNDQLTKESFVEEDGIRWFYTGDIAEVHPDGTFRIIDRKKDLVKLQFGEYVSLGKVESALLTCSSVDNVCVVGNGFITYLVALVVPNYRQLKKVAERFNKEHQSFEDMCADPEISKEITKSLQKHATECRLLRIEIPQKFKLCSEEWTPQSGLVTAAFKVKRKAIESYYREALNTMMGLQSNGTINSK